MENLPDNILIESYYAARKLQLNPEFVSLIQQEIIKRRLKVKLKKTS